MDVSRHAPEFQTGYLLVGCLKTLSLHRAFHKGGEGKAAPRQHRLRLGDNMITGRMTRPLSGSGSMWLDIVKTEGHRSAQAAFLRVSSSSRQAY